MLWSFHIPPLFLWQCCSLSQGENYQCENLPWAKLAQPSSPAVHGQPALCPCPPALPRAVQSPWPVQLFSDACTDEFLTLLRQHSPGTLDHLASLIIIALFWCAVQRSVQVLTLHRPFGNWWSVFSRIRVIQTSCTCRLKSCNPRLHARTAVSVCQWLLNHTPESLQTLRLICTHSPAACQQVLHFQPWKYILKKWVSQCYFPHILLAAAHAFLELSFSLLPPLQLVRIFFWFYLWLPQWKSLYFFCF